MPVRAVRESLSVRRSSAEGQDPVLDADAAERASADLFGTARAQLVMAARHQYSVDDPVLAHHAFAHSVCAACLIQESLVQRFSERLDTARRARVQRFKLCDGQPRSIWHGAFATQ